MIKMKRQTSKAKEKTRGKDGNKGGVVFLLEREQKKSEGEYATHNLALHLLSPPPVTRLKIKIKIK